MSRHKWPTLRGRGWKSAGDGRGRGLEGVRREEEHGREGAHALDDSQVQNLAMTVLYTYKTVKYKTVKARFWIYKTGKAIIWP